MEKINITWEEQTNKNFQLMLEKNSVSFEGYG